MGFVDIFGVSPPRNYLLSPTYNLQNLGVVVMVLNGFIRVVLFKLSTLHTLHNGLVILTAM